MNGEWRTNEMLTILKNKRILNANFTQWWSEGLSLNHSRTASFFISVVFHVSEMAKQKLMLSIVKLLFTVVLVGYWIETSFLRTNIAQTPATDIWSSYGAELAWDGSRPLNFLFLGFGTRGDHQPQVALGLELSKLGHNGECWALFNWTCVALLITTI